MKRNHWTVVFAAVAAVFLVVAAGTVEAKTYKLASSLAITGPTSDAGAPYAKGMEDYARYANDEKLLGGDTVEMIIRDDQYKTDVTKRNFEEFLSQGIVMYLNYSTGSTLALKRDFDEEKMPTLPASFDRTNLVDSTYIFLPITSYSGQCFGLAEYLIKNHKGGGVPKVAMFIHPSAFGRAPVEHLRKGIAAGLKMEIVEVVEHGQDLDNTAMLQRLTSKGVQYVLCHTVQSPVATLLNDAQRLSLTSKEFGEAGKLTFMGAHYTGGNDLIGLAGAAAEGFFWTTSYKLTSEHKDLAEQQLAIAKKYGRDDRRPTRTTTPTA
jgi:branched-chain amino acid transport system substrate-binding protein